MDFIRRTHTVVPILVALVAAGYDFGLRPTGGFHVTYKAAKRSLGLVKLEPWRNRSVAAIARAVSAAADWMIALFRLRVPALCASAALLALLMADLNAAYALPMLATVVPVATITSVEQLRAERTQLLSDAEALSGADAAFQTDAARAAGDQARPKFDAALARVREIDARIQELQPTPTGPAPAPSPAATPTADSIRAEERARVSTITDLCRKFKIADAVRDALVNTGVPLEEARRQILDKLAAGSDAIDARQGGVTFGEDQRDKWIRGGVNWLLVRSGMVDMVAKSEKADIAKYDAGEFRGMSLLDMAREVLTRAGQNTRGLDRMDLAGRAMAYRANYQTTSDFATLLENAMHKVMRAAYQITPDTWSRWCGIGTVVDFRAHNWYRMGSLTALDDLNEHGEFKNKAIPDAEKATFKATTKGNIIGVTREVVVNDDLGAVMRLTEMLGRAGKLTIEKAAYALLGANAGLGPTQSDSQPLFHSNRSNVGSSSALTMAGLDADAAVMAVQTDPNGQDIIDLPPHVLLVSRGNQGTARAINEAEYDPDTTGKLQKPNIVKGMFADIVGTGRLAGNRRYLFADPSMAPVFLVCFLEGQREPVLESQDGWRYNGVELKARLDFGIDVVDYRGAVTNAGG